MGVNVALLQSDHFSRFKVLLAPLVLRKVIARIKDHLYTKILEIILTLATSYSVGRALD